LRPAAGARGSVPEAEAVAEIPSGLERQYEPKWHGFRCNAEIRSARSPGEAQKPLAARYPTSMKILTLALIAAAGAAYAQVQPAGPPVPSIQTTGQAVVEVKPDQAKVDVAVIWQAPTAQQAAAQNASRVDAVLKALRGAGGTSTEAQTVSYSLEPNYKYPKPGGAPEISGYTARNTVRATTSEMARVGGLIDAALGAGANQVERVEFTLKNDAEARAGALREAALKARASAQAIASALGLRILRVLDVQQGGGIQPVRPMMMSMAREAGVAAPPTPIEAGTIEVRAEVTLRVEVAQ
jgi:uncharacterized protein YggE